MGTQKVMLVQVVPVNPWASKTMSMSVVTLGDKRWARIWTGEGKVRKERPYMVAEARRGRC